MFANRLSQEYALLATELGFTRPDLVVLARNAIDASWLPHDRKQDLMGPSPASAREYQQSRTSAPPP